MYRSHVCSNNARGAYVTRARINNLFGLEHFDITNTNTLKVCNTMYKRVVRCEEGQQPLKNSSFCKKQKTYSNANYDVFLRNAISCKTNRK